MSGRDWRRPRVDAVRAEATVARRMDAADPSLQENGRDGVLCERCGEWMPKGTPMRRVNAKEAPSGEGGYVHAEGCEISPLWGVQL